MEIICKLAKIMEIIEIEKYLNIFQIHNTMDDLQLVTQFQKEGIHKFYAERIVAFFPMAFGRHTISMLGNVIFSDKFKMVNLETEFDLINQPVYQSAKILAEKYYGQNETAQTIYAAISTRSAEVGAINKALAAKSDINGAKLGPQILWGYSTLTDTEPIKEDEIIIGTPVLESQITESGKRDSFFDRIKKLFS